MAYIQKGTQLSEINHDEFNTTYKPTDKPIYPGIYKCCECGYEIIHSGGYLSDSEKLYAEKFPGEHTEDHPHLWMLLVSIYKPYVKINPWEE